MLESYAKATEENPAYVMSKLYKMLEAVSFLVSFSMNNYVMQTHDVRQVVKTQSGLFSYRLLKTQRIFSM